MQTSANASGVTQAIGVVCVILFGAMASCGARNTNGQLVKADGRSFELLTCRGAIQNDVRCSAGFDEVGRFDDGIVCREKGAPTNLPVDVCAQLPGGCNCAASSPCAPRPERPFLTSETEERCDRNDPNCGPIPSDHSCLTLARYDANAPRRFVAAGNDRGIVETCAHDGECTIRRDCDGPACGHSGSEPKCEKETHTRSSDLPRLCGCLAGRCSWFRQ